MLRCLVAEANRLIMNPETVMAVMMPQAFRLDRRNPFRVNVFGRNGSSR